MACLLSSALNAPNPSHTLDVQQNVDADANFNVTVMTKLSSVRDGGIKIDPSPGAVIY